VSVVNDLAINSISNLLFIFVIYHVYNIKISVIILCVCCVRCRESQMKNYFISVKTDEPMRRMRCLVLRALPFKLVASSLTMLLKRY